MRTLPGATRRILAAAVIGLGPVAAAFVPVVPAAAAATLHVATGGTDTGNCQTSACATLSYALDQAPSGATIDVGSGTFTDHELLPVQPVTIVGAGAGTTTLNITSGFDACGTTYVGSALYLNGGLSICGATLVPGAYTFGDMTLQGVAGATASTQPILVSQQNLPNGTTVTFNDDRFVSDATTDPNHSDDFPVGVYAATSSPDVHEDVTGSTFSGFYQAFFLEQFAGKADVTSSTFTNLSTQSGFPPVAVYLLSDGSQIPNPDMNGPYTLSGNTMSGYSGNGIIAAAGLGDPLHGTLSDVAVTGNTIDLPEADYPGSSPLRVSSAITVKTATPQDSVAAVTISKNHITSAGSNAIDIQVNGSPTITGVTIRSNDLLGGPSTVGVRDAAGAGVGAAGNWWGDPAGPSGAGAGSQTQAPAGLDFARWCVTALPRCPSVPAPPGPATAAPIADPSATVSWTTPATDGDRDVTRYTVTPRNKTTGTRGRSVTVAASARSATIKHLSAGDTYDFLVTADNANGPSDPALTNEIIVPKPPPSRIRVTKSGHASDTNHDGTIDAGDTITWTITVVNTGRTTLSHIVVTDAGAGDPVSCPASTLAPATQLRCTSSSTVTSADARRGHALDRAEVRATTPSGTTLTAQSAQASVDVHQSPTPAGNGGRPSPAPTPGASEGSALPFTGFNAESLLTAALILLVGGAALLTGPPLHRSRGRRRARR
jgi:Fibronectin type III domain